jgi:hypothetical protein
VLPEEFEQRPMVASIPSSSYICTEYIARGAGSTFDTILPIAKKYRVAAINWGFVAGKTHSRRYGFTMYCMRMVPLIVSMRWT